MSTATGRVYRMATDHPKRIIAFDPGGTTGVARHIIREEKRGPQTLVKYHLESDELRAGNHHELLIRELDAFKPDVVVTERFDYRAKQKHAELISVEYIGVMRLWCQKFGVELVEQQQLKGDKGLWTDDKLKVLDLYKSTTGGHSNDAVRQMLYFITVTLEDKFYIERYGRRTRAR